jgi:hypothetical protein
MLRISTETPPVMTSVNYRWTLGHKAMGSLCSGPYLLANRCSMDFSSRYRTIYSEEITISINLKHSDHINQKNDVINTSNLGTVHNSRVSLNTGLLCSNCLLFPSKNPERYISGMISTQSWNHQPIDPDFCIIHSCRQKSKSRFSYREKGNV